MKTLAEIREHLVSEIEIADKCLEMWEQRRVVAVAALTAHDEAVEATRAEKRPLVEVISISPPERHRKRNLAALTLDHLTAEPKTVAELAAAIGDVSEVRMSQVLLRLRDKKQAMMPPGETRWVRHPSLLIQKDTP